MRRAPNRLDLECDEALVSDGDNLLRRLRDDRSVCRGAPDERFGAEAPDLFVGDSRDDDVAPEPLPHGCGADQHARRQRALHVARATAVKAAVADRGRERALRAGDTDGVHVRVEEERTPSTRPARDSDDVRSARCGLVVIDLETGRVEPRGDERRDLTLADAVGDEIGVRRLDRDEPSSQLRQIVDDATHRARRTRSRRREPRPSCSGLHAGLRRRSWLRRSR